MSIGETESFFTNAELGLLNVTPVRDPLTERYCILVDFLHLFEYTPSGYVKKAVKTGFLCS